MIQPQKRIYRNDVSQQTREKQSIAHQGRKPPSASYPLTPDRRKTQKEGVLALANEGYQVKSFVDRTDRQSWG